MSKLVSIRVCTRDKNGEEIDSAELAHALESTRNLFFRLAGGCEERTVKGYWLDDKTLHEETTHIVEGVIPDVQGLDAATLQEIEEFCKVLRNYLHQSSVLYTIQPIQATFVGGK